MSGLLSVEEARDRVLGAIPAPLPAEEVAVGAALGRVLAAGVVATTDLPPWDNSAMDGYALVAADVISAVEAAPVRLPVTGEVAAGAAAAAPVTRGSAVRIATGAPLPPGADAVVPVELTAPLDGAGVAGPRGRDAAGPLPVAVQVHAAVGTGANVRARGSDLRAGTTVLAAGSAVGPAEVALVAGAGVAAVAVHRRPRVAVISTGDELRPAGADLGPAGIPDSNGPGLAALAAAAGADARHLGIGPDDLGATVALLREAIGWADVVLASGGVSVGPHDVVRAAFEAVGSVDLWRVAIQPGKPFAFGRAVRPAGADAAGPVLLFGLPGNPASVFVTFEIFVRPALRRLAGRRPGDLLRPIDAGVLEEPVAKSSGRRAYLRVVARRAGPGAAPLRDSAGRARVQLAGGQSSHRLSGVAAADALAVVPESVDALAAGAPVELWWLDRP